MKTGDSVRIMRGDRKGFEGKITRVDRGNYRIFIEGVTREKVDGSTVQIPIHPSKVMLTNLDLDDKWRRETMKRKIASPKRSVAVPAAETASEEKKEAKKPPRRRRVDRKQGKEKKKKTEPEKSAPSKSKKPKKTPKPKRRQRKTKKAKAKEGAE